MKKILLGISLLILVGAAIFAWKHYDAKNQRVRGEELFWQGRQASSESNDLKALEQLSEAVKLSPDNAEFNFYAGISARNMGKKDLAYSYFKKAWDIGKKDPEVFINMNSTSSLPTIEKSIYFETLVNDLSDEQVRYELLALLKYQREELEEAARLLQKLVSKHPEGAYAEFYAQVLMRLQQPESALNMLEGIRNDGKLNQASYIILSNLYIAIDNMNAASELFTEAQEGGMDSTEVILNYGRSLFYYGGGDLAYDLLSPLSLPKIFSSGDISSPTILHEDLKSNTPLANFFLEQSNPALKAALEKPIGDRFSNQKFIELSRVALNKFCNDRSWFTPELIPTSSSDLELRALSEKKDLSDIESFMRNARTLVAAFPDSLKVPDYSFSTHRARIILQVLASATENTEELEELKKLGAGSRRWLEGERYFADYLLETSKETSSAEKAQEYFEAAVLLLDNNDTVQINLADNLAKRGEFQDALVVFDKTAANSLILSRSPMILEMRSRAMIASGNLQGGQNILISLFRRGYITEALLYELSQVSIDLKDEATAKMALAKLGELSSKFPSLRLLTSEVLLKGGDYAQAIQELSMLLDSTSDAQLKRNALILKATAELANDQADNALKTISSIKESTQASQILKAQALNAIDSKDDALHILESITPLPSNALSLYATLLAGTGRLDEAKTQLEELLKSNPDNIDAHTNLALILDTQGNSEGAIKEIEEVLDIAPEDIRGNLILSQIYLSTSRPKEAVSLAQKVLSIAPSNPVALTIIPSAYNALQNYPRAIKSADYALRSQSENPFIIMQKAIGLVGLSKDIENTRVATGVKRQGTKAKSEEESLKDEIASLTGDILYTGAISELGNTQQINTESEALEYAKGRSSKELQLEAIVLLDSIIDQSAAKVYKLEILLMLGESEKVIEEVSNGKMKENELFSLGVIADNRKDWTVASAAYFNALKLQPENPVILNNYSYAVVMSKTKLDTKTKEVLLDTAANVPALLKGDVKAVNTAAIIYNYLKEWDKTVELSKTYPKVFKLSPKLNELLNTATSSIKTK